MLWTKKKKLLNKCVEQLNMLTVLEKGMPNVNFNLDLVHQLLDSAIGTAQEPTGVCETNTECSASPAS